MKKRNYFIVFILLIFASALPAIIGFGLPNGNSIYSGVVFNPVDGYTYLAKMEIGNSGEWLFRLPFTAQAGEGRLLYPFYIAAGHFFQISGVSLSAGFNLIRLASYGCLILVLWLLANHLFPDKKSPHELILFLMAAGGGLGWILLPFGKFGADFWVSEAYPFLAGLANPHFPLSLALMILPVWISNQKITGILLVLCGLSAFFLSVLSPFGFVLIAIVLFLAWASERWEGQTTSLKTVLVFFAAGLPYSVYQFWAVRSTPQLAAWTAQNLTPSPAIWDVILSFSPWIILLSVCWRFLYDQRKDPVIRRLIIWVVAGMILTIVPFNLQRRFMIGLSIPITSLGLLVLPIFAEKINVPVRKLLTFCTAVVIPTTILILIMVSFAIGTRSTLYFLEHDELAAIQWLAQQKDGNSLVLASDQTGLMLPAFSRLRVLSGHPFETVDAENEKQGVTDFFTGNMNLSDEKVYLKNSKTDWIFFGPREKELGSPHIIQGNQPAMQFGSVLLYKSAEITE